MKASDFIIDYISRNKTDKIFGYIGGMITHIADSAYQSKKISLVHMINEQGVAFAAEGYARASAKTGVAFATSGPGATNLLTGVASCYFDSVPVLFITGQVNTYEYKGDIPVRQRGFQETDIVSMAKPVAKYCALVDNAKNLRYELEKAWFLTSHGRKGPTLLDIPMNIQRADLDFSKQRSFIGSREHSALIKKVTLKLSDVKKISTEIARANAPVILAGGGVRCANACDILKKFSKKNEIAVVQSLMGRDSIEASDLNLGLMGVYANRAANFALANADLVLILGSRLDGRQTGGLVESFANGAKIIRIDIDENELKHSKVRSDISVCADLLEFLKKLIEFDCRKPRKKWMEYLRECANAFPSEKGIDGEILEGNAFVKNLSKSAKKAKFVSADVGQHQMWMAQSFDVSSGQRLLFSGGMGAMGFALPAAIGAAEASGKMVLVVCGDGGMQMNIQELEIIKRRNLPVKIFVLNNSCLGMVRQFQEMYFEGRCAGTVEDYSAPDFHEVGKAYGIKSHNINSSASAKSLEKFFADSSPCVVNVRMSENTEVSPKLLLNKPIEDMSPYLKREDFLKFMTRNDFK